MDLTTSGGHVLVVTSVFEPWVSGVTTRINAIAKGLGMRFPGWRLSIATFNPGPVGPYAGIHAVHRIPGIRSSGAFTYDPVLAPAPLLVACTQDSPTIVHLFGPHPASVLLVPLCALLGIPLVVSYNTDIARAASVDLGDTMADYAMARLQDMHLHNCINTVICMSHGHRLDLERRGLLDSSTRSVHTLPPFVDTTRFHPRSGPRRSGVLRVISCSRVSPEKRIDWLVQAVLGCGGCVHLTVVGDGPDTARLSAIVGASEHVQFVGAVPHSRVARYYRDADVFASASSFETCGLTTLEALACGLPIVVCPQGGSTDFLAGVGGYAASTPGEFQAVFMQLAREDPRTLYEHGRRCADYASHYDRVSMVRSLLAIYTTTRAR